MQGRHVKVVGRARSIALSNCDVVDSFLRDLTHAIGMRVTPVVHLHDEGGATGVATSSAFHVVLHTWDAERRLMLDVFSAVAFHDLTVVSAVSRHFGLSRYHVFDFTHALLVTP